MENTGANNRRGKRVGHESMSDQPALKSARREEESLNLDHLKLARFDRTKLAKFVHAPFFKDTVVGCFVKLGVGRLPGNLNRENYRIAQILDVVEVTKVYNIEQTGTNKGLKLRVGSEDRAYRIEFISNIEFKDSEFDEWMTSMNIHNHPLPTIQHIHKKMKDIENAENHTYTNEEVDMIVKEKARFKEVPNNHGDLVKKLMSLSRPVSPLRKKQRISGKKDNVLSLPELPFEILEKIFYHLDLETRFKLRLCKRLDQVQLSVKNTVELIILDIFRDSYELDIDELEFTLCDMDKLAMGFRRLALNTHVNSLSLLLPSHLIDYESVNRALDEFVKFDAEKFRLYLPRGRPNFPLIDSSRLFTLAQNVRELSISDVHSSLDAKDISSLRKAMLDRSCKMEKLCIRVSNTKALMNACFGARIDAIIDDEGDAIGKKFMAADESIELFSKCPGGKFDIHHYEGNLESSIVLDEYGHNKKHNFIFYLHESKPQPDPGMELIKFNHVYPVEYSDTSSDSDSD